MANIAFIYLKRGRGNKRILILIEYIDRYIFEAIAGFSLFSDSSIETDVIYSLEYKSCTCDRSYWQAGGRHI